MSIIDLLILCAWGYGLYLIRKKFTKKGSTSPINALFNPRKTVHTQTNARLQFIISTVSSYIDYQRSKGVDVNNQILSRRFFAEAYRTKEGKEPDDELTVCFDNIKNENHDYNVPDWLNVYACEWLANHELS